MSNLLSPIEGVLALLDEGAATGTNKYGLLLALLELAPEVGPDGVITWNGLRRSRSRSSGTMSGPSAMRCSAR